MKTEEFVKEYVKNKNTYRVNVINNIRFLTEDLVNNVFTFDIEIKDLIMPHKPLRRKENNNIINDQVAETLIKYEGMKSRFLEQQDALLNEKLEYLFYLTALKDIYDQIDFRIIKLSPKEKISIDIYASGGKVDQIASELECSYNTARVLLKNTLDVIIGDICIKMEQNGINCHHL